MARSGPPIILRSSPSSLLHLSFHAEPAPVASCGMLTSFFRRLQPDRLPVEIALQTGQSEIALLLLSAGGGGKVLDTGSLSAMQRSLYIRKRSQVDGILVAYSMLLLAEAVVPSVKTLTLPRCGNPNKHYLDPVLVNITDISSHETASSCSMRHLCRAKRMLSSAWHT